MQCHQQHSRATSTKPLASPIADKACPRPLPPPHLAISKRTMLLSALTALAPELATKPSRAGEGNALTNFLRSRQAANGASSVLAPIRGSRLRLQDAQGIINLSAQGGGDVTQALGLERTEAELDALIASFRLLDLHMDKLRLDPEDNALRSQAQQTLASTIEQTVAFESVILECLGV